ncbi:MAG: hypothetical protein Q7J44_14230 [Pseudotabrizicola sp.]|uniref:hypothetical protein n=1 Tax=Pseudotabrizicola sp. TaxID=2939647 RepID=UPI0027164601|nr:hypothetical protein [Pseudotabrizicola sp.]MDO9639694.1 hypothetical protein [Pseudotabrizicola sp.]
MKLFDSATSAYLARRAGNTARVLIRIWAENRTTSEIESLGLWAGEQDQEFTIRGTVQMFYRSAGKVDMDEIIAQPGTDVYMTSVTLSPIDAKVRAMVGGYELRFAPVEIYRALFWPETGELVAEPVRLFKGWIDRMPTDLPEVGESAELKVSLASAARALTRTLAFKKSDPALSGARSGDRFRCYTDVGSVQVPWGEKRVGNAQPAPQRTWDPNSNPFTGTPRESGDR